MKTFSIIYGFAEGPKTANKLLATLQSSGLKSAPADEADLIIAHSGGCFLIPQNLVVSKIILINPTIWPKRSLLQSIKLRNDLHLSIWSFWYALTRPADNYRMFTRRTSQYLPAKEKSLIIKNEQDTYFSLAIYKELAKQGYNVVELPGGHDDIWNNPEMYLQFLT